MNKLTNLLFWSTAFLMLSFSNLSGLCKHGVKQNGFGWKPSGSIHSSLPVGRPSLLIAENASATDSPAKLTWEMLKDVDFIKKWNKDYKMDIFYPVFGKDIKKWAGKEMYITGYMIPLNIEAGLYALSKYNYASCFFCGRSGPESVVSLKFKAKPRRYKTDEYLTMKGTLELNDANVGDFIYIFRNTEEYKQ